MALRQLRSLKHTIILLFLLPVLVGCILKPRPPSGTLTYKGPLELKAEPGKNLPGTDILYVGVSDKMAEFKIGGQRALKKVGDSLDWQGTPTPGVRLDLNLRILLISEQALHAGGTIDMEVENPTPRAMALDTGSQAKFSVPVTYGVERGENIPGTLLVYQERDAEKGAKLGGIADYPYRKMGDSLVWEGKLRDNVSLKLDLRVLFFNENSLRVGGVATLWLEL